MQTEDGLTKRALEYIKGIRDLYVSEPINDDVEIEPLSFVK